MIVYVALPWPEILPFRWGAVLWWSSGGIHMIMDCSPLSPDTPIWFAESSVVGKYPVGSEMGLGGRNSRDFLWSIIFFCFLDIGSHIAMVNCELKWPAELQLGMTRRLKMIEAKMRW